MADELQKKPDSITPITEVNQYGDRSLHADHIDNLNVEVNVFGNQGSASKDEDGKPYVPIMPTRYDSTTRTVFLGNETVKLPVELIPQSAITPHELPYINALCEVYAEKINKAVSPDMIDTLSPGLRRNYVDQRKAYYSAVSVQRSVREVFSDGKQQFEALKTDAFDGISTTYYDDRHLTGYDRLQAVLEKITNTTLTKSALMNIVGLIGNLEKKGVCHILVNDEVIKSWVNIDE
ncbi:MAG: hypothetical protein HDQ99_04255 [Lachnospiraceae bacterium]|nr:hypothetical protein [Lachnospiraceae bacterium]